MSRPRSIRPRKAPRSQQLTAVLRLLGRPDPGLLEAALEPADAQAIQKRAEGEPPDSLLAIAISVCLEVHDSWQRLTTAQRAQVRGFSLPLLGLAADQTLCLERALAEHGTLAAEHSLAVARLRELVPRCALLCAQAAHVLERVAGGPNPAEEAPATAANTTFALAQSLHRLAHAGQELLRSANPAVRKRALLYSLNDAFLDGLAAAGAELVRVNEKACGTGPLETSRQMLGRAHRATFFLVTLIGEAFAAAHSIDPLVPALQSALVEKRTVDAPASRKTIDFPPVRQAHVVVLSPSPRVLDVSELGASGVIRKRSKPPLR